MKKELGEIYDCFLSFFKSGKNKDIWEPLLKLYENSLDLEERKKQLLSAERSIVVAGMFIPLWSQITICGRTMIQ